MDIGKLSLWEWMCAVEGYALANGAKPRGGDISEDRLSEIGIAGF